MSLYDGNYNTEHLVQKSITKTFIKDGIENEFVFNIIATYDIDRSLLCVDCDYWAHFIYNEETGFEKLSSGEYVDDMTEDVRLIFKLIEGDF